MSVTGKLTRGQPKGGLFKTARPQQEREDPRLRWGGALLGGRRVGKLHSRKYTGCHGHAAAIQIARSCSARLERVAPRGGYRKCRRARGANAETRPPHRRASSTGLPALPENANREWPQLPQEVAPLIREPVRKSGALTTRISRPWSRFSAFVRSFASCSAHHPPRRGLEVSRARALLVAFVQRESRLKRALVAW